MIDRRKSVKTLSEVKSVENTGKNLQRFLEISQVQNEVLPLHKLRDHEYEYYNPFGLKADTLTKKLPESIEPFRSASQGARMSGGFDSRKDSQP